MGGWQEKVIKEFETGISPITLVADPDNLLSEPGLAETLRLKGFDTLKYQDPVEFRFIYESQYRSRKDTAEQKELAILTASEEELESLPYDLLQRGRTIKIGLMKFFPELSCPVLITLDRAHLDKLFTACDFYKPGRLGEHSTEEFILRHVFEIAPEIIKTTEDLLRVLLQIHYKSVRLPEPVLFRLVQILRQNRLFKDWPLEKLFSDRFVFFRYLQERWHPFLHSLAEEDGAVCEELTDYGFDVPGPAILPFSHHDVRIYVDNLFLEGLLKPVKCQLVGQLENTWARSGLVIEPQADKVERLGGLLDIVNRSLPTHESPHQDWLRFAFSWAEVNWLAASVRLNKRDGLALTFAKSQRKVDEAFLEWMHHRYPSLHNLPAFPPVMVHHIPRYLAQKQAGRDHPKVALVVVDGLSLEQWLTIRDCIESDTGFMLKEDAVFAWVPTTTAVSRQAMFSGKPPVYFPGSIETTYKEEFHWRQFWQDQGLSHQKVLFAKGLGDEKLDTLEEQLNHRSLRVAGLIVDKIDRIMHGMQLGMAGMHNQVGQWSRQGYLSELFTILIDLEFEVFVTSDHGNVEAYGIGSPAEGALAVSRGQRARIYPSNLLRDQVRNEYPDSIRWNPHGLPEGFFPLVAPHRRAFVFSGKRIVSHGGISIEEVIVPFVEVQRREN